MRERNVRIFIALCFVMVMFSTALAALPLEPFSSQVEGIPDNVREQMTGRDWKEGCPVPLDQLAYVKLTHLGYDGKAHSGAIIVHKDLAQEVVDIFRELYEIHFPIERMEPHSNYAASGYAEHNATVGFYCRPDQEKPSQYSVHSYGLAIDLNPLVNPYRDPKEGWWPAGSAVHSDRSVFGKGKIAPNSHVFNIFREHGWIWGGTFRDPDYMHFEKGIIGDRSKPMSSWYFTTGLRYGNP